MRDDGKGGSFGRSAPGRTDVGVFGDPEIRYQIAMTKVWPPGSSFNSAKVLVLIWRAGVGS